MSLLRRSLSVATVVVLASAGLGVNASAEDASTSAPGRPDLTVGPAPMARGLIVQTTTSTPSDSLLQATDEALGIGADVVDDDVLLKKVSTVDFDQLVPVEVAADAAAAIEQRADVVWAAPNRMRTATALPPVTPDDPFFDQQRNLWDSSYASAGYSIKAPSIWQATTGSPDVTVAVLDTGVRKEHPELAGQLVEGYDMISDPANTRDHDGRDDDPTDPGDRSDAGDCGDDWPGQFNSWHGTFVAGQVAAKQGNRTGISGIAPGVKVRPVRVLGTCGGDDSDIIAGMAWASGQAVSGVSRTAAPAQVVNMSLSGAARNTTERRNECKAYEAVIKAAPETVFVAAAGNDFGSANLAVPAACPGVVSVGATSHKGFSASYSNIGSSVDLSAPGGDTRVEGSKDVITSLSNTGAVNPDASSYAKHEGTSMAAPEVSSAAALLYSLGLTAPKEVTAGLYALAQPFRARSSSYADKDVRIDGRTYAFDLNCRGQDWCGRGILNLARVQAPLTKPTISGSGVLGEPLTAVPGTWVSKPSTYRYQWYNNGSPIDGATARTYYSTRADVGAELSVRTAPATAAFEKLGSTSDPQVLVADGPDVTLALRNTLKYGTPAEATVTVSSGGVPVDGDVELRRGATVLASGPTTGGTVTLTVGGTSWQAGSNPVRAAFIADQGTPAASSAGVSVAVSKASASVTTSLRTSVRRTSRATIGVTVKVAGVPNPTGQLRVYDGSRKIGYASLVSSARGKRSIVLPKLSKGKHAIKVVYSGTPNITGKTSKVRGITSY